MARARSSRREHLGKRGAGEDGHRRVTTARRLPIVGGRELSVKSEIYADHGRRDCPRKGTAAAVSVQSRTPRRTAGRRARRWLACGASPDASSVSTMASTGDFRLARALNRASSPRRRRAGDDDDPAAAADGIACRRGRGGPFADGLDDGQLEGAIGGKAIGGLDQQAFARGRGLEGGRVHLASRRPGTGPTGPSARPAAARGRPIGRQTPPCRPGARRSSRRPAVRRRWRLCAGRGASFPPLDTGARCQALVIVFMA